MAEEQAMHSRPLAVELLPLTKYWLAEEYHQDYLKKHPGGYCHIDFCTLDELPPAPAASEDGKADAEGLGAYSGSYISAPATSATILAESSAIISATSSE